MCRVSHQSSTTYIILICKRSQINLLFVREGKRICRLRRTKSWVCIQHQELSQFFCEWPMSPTFVSTIILLSPPLTSGPSILKLSRKYFCDICIYRILEAKSEAPTVKGENKIYTVGSLAGRECFSVRTRKAVLVFPKMLGDCKVNLTSINIIIIV